VKTLKYLVLILVLPAGVIVGALIHAPGFLLYATNYSKADVIVLLLGPDFSARQKHAQRLINDGMADYLIIPAYHKIYHVDQGSLKLLSGKNAKEKNQTITNGSVPRYYEDTHIELLAAKKMMEQYGKTSAIFVSSPYHMRRIRIMVKKEFGAYDYYYFAPTPYETAPSHLLQLSSADWKKVYREYLKITWFMIYSLWVK
jgi:hypothetical protein